MLDVVLGLLLGEKFLKRERSLRREGKKSTRVGGRRIFPSLFLSVLSALGRLEVPLGSLLAHFLTLGCHLEPFGRTFCHFFTIFEVLLDGTPS